MCDPFVYALFLVININVGCPPWGGICHQQAQTSDGSHNSRGSIPYPLQVRGIQKINVSVSIFQQHDVGKWNAYP